MILEVYVKMRNRRDLLIGNVANKMLDEDGADAGSNFILGLGASVVVVGVILIAAKVWFPDAFNKIGDKALEILGIS